MKDLNDYLWEECLQHLDLGENGPYDEMAELQADIVKAIKGWLEERRAHFINKHKFCLDVKTSMDHLIGELDVPKESSEVKKDA